MAIEHEDKALWPPVDPVSAGLRGRCPRCGEGRLFSGFLALAPHCGNCRLDYAFADSGDGPAVFVILIVGALIGALALGVEMSYGPPLWLHFVLWFPLALVLCAWALRAFKGLLIALQYRNKAEQGRLDN
jgi:uncharacterized protein (DUF983 family)